MKLKNKHTITIFTTLIASTLATIPMFACFNYAVNQNDKVTDKDSNATTDVSGENQSPIDGETIDIGNGVDPGQDNDFILGGKKGTIPKAFEELDSKRNSIKYHAMSKTYVVNFLDYNLPSVDSKNNFVYLKDRGDLVNKVVEIKSNNNFKQNKDDFMKSFDFYKYRLEANESTGVQNNTTYIPEPDSSMFLDDIYSWVLPLYDENNQFIDIKIDKNEINFIKGDNSLSFDISFTIKNVRNIPIEFSYFNKKTTLAPFQSSTLKLYASKQKIKNVVNVFDDKYFLGWQIPTMQVSFDNNQFNYNNFNPTPTQPSFTYRIEFLNITDGENPSVANNTDAANFMNNLTPEIIKTNLDEAIYANTNKVFGTLPHLATIFNSLNSNPTVGQFLYDSAQPIANILILMDVLPKELSPVLVDLIQSAYNGKGIIEIINKNQNNLSTTLKKLLADSLGDMGNVIDEILSQIKVGMSKEEVDNFIGLLDLVYPSNDQNPSVKSTIIQIIKLLLGNYDANGRLIDKGNPFILDLVERLLSTAMINETQSVLESFGLKTDWGVLKALSSIFNILSERTRFMGSTDASSGKVIYKYKIIDKLFDIEHKDTKSYWWLINYVIDILKTFGLNIGYDNTDLLYQLIHQTYTVNYNKLRLNAFNAKIAINEITSAINFLANKNNFDISGYYLTSFNGKPIRYDSKNHTFDFIYRYKLTFKKAYVFSIDIIFNLLPTHLYIEIFKLTGDEWLRVKWALSTFSFYTKERYVSINLERILYRMFPRKIAFEVGDTFNMEYSANKANLVYSQNKINSQYYHGFNGVLNVDSFFTQADPYKGVITNAVSSAWIPSDFQDIDKDTSMNKQHPDWTISEVTAYVKYEDGSNSQGPQNVNAVKELVQKLFVNRLRFNITLTGVDKSKPIPAPKNVFYENQTFKWHDIDFDKEPIVVSESPKANSPKFDQYFNMFNYSKELSNDSSFWYSHIKNSSGDKSEGALTREFPTFSNESIKTLEKDLFHLGNGVDRNKTIVSIRPITNLKISKTVDIKGGADVLFFGYIEAMTMELSLSIQFMMFQVTVITPNKVLDLSNVSRNQKGYNLSNYKYSNVFDKIFMAPRITAKIPNL